MDIYKVISLSVPVFLVMLLYQGEKIGELEELVEKYKAVERENLVAVSSLREQLKETNMVVRAAVKREVEIDGRGSEVVKSVEKSNDWGECSVPADVSKRLREYGSKD